MVIRKGGGSNPHENSGELGGNNGSSVVRFARFVRDVGPCLVTASSAVVTWFDTTLVLAQAGGEECNSIVKVRGYVASSGCTVM